MFTVAETVTIARSVEDVFDYLTDGANRPHWDASVISEESTSPGPLGVGSTLRTRQRAAGREVEFEWRVARFDRPTGMALVSESGPVQTSVTFEFSPAGAGCVVRATVEGSPTGMMRFVEPMISEAVRTTFGEGLTKAKALLESRSAE